MIEIHTLDELVRHINEHQSLKDTVGQSVDVSSVTEDILSAKIDNTVFLGCDIPGDAQCTLINPRGSHLSDSDWPSVCLLYTSPSPRDATLSRMPSSA